MIFVLDLSLPGAGNLVPSQWSRSRLNPALWSVPGLIHAAHPSKIDKECCLTNPDVGPNHIDSRKNSTLACCSTYDASTTLSKNILGLLLPRNYSTTDVCYCKRKEPSHTYVWHCLWLCSAFAEPSTIGAYLRNRDASPSESIAFITN